ncbi:MAG TPA: CHAT domain-containing protein [Blastocatellia bacterium]|nr:CHAT domain-containing protein [Blastocatellia bacterium]
MSSAFGVSFCLLALSFSLIGPAPAQSHAVPNPPASAEVNELAAALARAGSEQEQDGLLERRKDLLNASLLVALKELADPLSQKGDYAEAQRITQLAVRIAEKMGDRKGLGEALHNLGLIYSRQNRAAQAIESLQKSLAIFEESGGKKETARELYHIGLIHRLQGRLDQALEYFNRSQAISEEIGDKSLTAMALNNIGIVHRVQGRHELALEFYRRSLALGEELNDKPVIRNVLNSIGNVYQAQGSYELALRYYERSRVLDEELNDKAGLARTIYNIGAVYNFQGRYAEALACFQKSIKIIEEMGSAADRKDLAYNFHSLGRLYVSQGRYDQALEYYHKSLKIREEVDDKFGVGQTQNNIGVVYKSQGLYDQALEWFQKRLKLAEQMGVKEGIASSLSNIGDIYRLQGRSDLALEHLGKSLRLREEMVDRRGICVSLENLGLVYRDRGSYAEMLDASRRAADLAEEINAPEELWKGREQMGIALRALGQPVEARRNFLAAISTIESLRNEVAGGGQQQQSFLENRLSPWLGMIALLVSQKEYIEALSFAERSKARVLLDVLQAGSASLRKSLSPQERQAEEQQRLRLVSLNSQLTGEVRRDKPDLPRVAELKGNIEKYRLEYEALETSLYVAHPELKTHRGEAPIIKAGELAALLPDSASALLEYVVSDDKTYLFAVTKAAGKAEAEIQLYTLPIKRDDLARQIDAFRGQLAARDLGFRPSASNLYDLLLKPAQAQLRGKSNLVIAPDNTLWDLPFQALLTSSNRFLIEDASIAYAPSLTALREMSRRRKDQAAASAPQTLLALGNPLLANQTLNRAALALRDGKLDPLPEAEQEVKALSQLYGSSRSKIYTGAEAREDRVKTEAGQASILHFATHGMLNNASPMYSHLAFAQGGPDEDGLLEAWELMQMDLRADLAVLSACETARGRIGAGEGITGLSWAMFIAGVPSIVVSQWKVESAGTRDLMVNFHRGLISEPGAGKAKATKVEALRQAALKLMKNPETSHPFYWAGFVLMGDGR